VRGLRAGRALLAYLVSRLLTKKPARVDCCVCERTSIPNTRGSQLFRTQAHLRGVIIERVRARLYERLLGEAWNKLDEPVRRLHTRAEQQCFEGVFVVGGARGLIARALKFLFRLPANGQDVSVQLEVRPSEGGGHFEYWHRTFGGRAFVTEQWDGGCGMLAERAGPLEILFRVGQLNGALVYRSARAALWIGPLRLPLPRLLAPRVDAHESGAPDGDGVSVYVCANAPLLGTLIAYKGVLRLQGGSATMEVEEA